MKEFRKNELPNWLANAQYDGSIENEAPFFIVNDNGNTWGSRIDNNYFTLID